MNLMIENIFDPSQSLTLNTKNDKRSIAREVKSSVLDLLSSQEKPTLTTILVTHDHILSGLINNRVTRFLMPDDFSFGVEPELEFLYKHYYSGTNVLVGTSGFSLSNIIRYYEYAREVVDKMGLNVLILVRYDPFTHNGTSVPLTCINKSDVVLRAARKIYGGS